jgi:hypothetical protein
MPAAERQRHGLVRHVASLHLQGCGNIVMFDAIPQSRVEVRANAKTAWLKPRESGNSSQSEGLRLECDRWTGKREKCAWSPPRRRSQVAGCRSHSARSPALCGAERGVERAIPVGRDALTGHKTKRCIVASETGRREGVAKLNGDSRRQRSRHRLLSRANGERRFGQARLHH